MTKNSVRRCLFTYQPLLPGEALYSARGLKKLSPKLARLEVFPYTAEQQRKEAQRLAGKISIQGMQPKLSVVLQEKSMSLSIVESNGRYIVKPQVSDYAELPENEDLTMHLAEFAGFAVPWHGLIQCEDGRRSYIVRRFDRIGKNRKLPQEDFAQLIGATRSTKYLATTERVVAVLEEFCTFPTLEYVKFYRLVIFSFLIGNEDLHLKNLTLTTAPNKTQLSPVYDLVNSTIALAAPEEELALELNGKKRGFSRSDFVDHLGIRILQLPEKVAIKEMDRLLSKVPDWLEFIEISFLSKTLKRAYQDVLITRAKRLSI